MVNPFRGSFKGSAARDQQSGMSRVEKMLLTAPTGSCRVAHPAPKAGGKEYMVELGGGPFLPGKDAMQLVASGSKVMVVLKKADVEKLEQCSQCAGCQRWYTMQQLRLSAITCAMCGLLYCQDTCKENHWSAHRFTCSAQQSTNGVRLMGSFPVPCCGDAASPHRAGYAATLEEED